MVEIEQGVLFLVGLFLIASAIGIACLWVDECPQCPHCKAEKRRKRLEQERLQKRHPGSPPDKPDEEP